MLAALFLQLKSDKQFQFICAARDRKNGTVAVRAWSVTGIVGNLLKFAAPVGHRPDGGDFLDVANWTIALPEASDTPVISNECESTISRRTIATMSAGRSSSFAVRGSPGPSVLPITPYGNPSSGMGGAASDSVWPPSVPTPEQRIAGM
jgi:hypothetical protein